MRNSAQKDEKSNKMKVLVWVRNRAEPCGTRGTVPRPDPSGTERELPP